MIAELVQNGLSEPDAENVMAIAIPKISEDANVDWNGDESGYPKILYPILYESIKPIALKWIDENCHQAWFRLMFMPKDEVDEILQTPKS